MTVSHWQSLRLRPWPHCSSWPARRAKSPQEAAPAPAAARRSRDAPQHPPTGTETMAMQKIELTPGTGAEIKSGQTALVHYTGWLYDVVSPENKGKKFDSSVDRNEPFEFPRRRRHGHPGLGRGRGRHEGRRQASSRDTAGNGLRRARRRRSDSARCHAGVRRRAGGNSLMTSRLRCVALAARPGGRRGRRPRR